jgi:hypothetical protein
MPADLASSSMGCRTRCFRNIHPRRLEDEFTVDFCGHRVYATPKENLIMQNEELNKLSPGTPGLGCLQALVQATPTQANRIDPSTLVG